MASNSSTIYDSKGYYWTLSVSASASGSSVSGTATLAGGNGAADSCQIQLYINGSLVNSNSGKCAGSSSYSSYPKSISCSGSLSCSDGSITVTAVSVAGSSGYAPAGSVSCSVTVSTWSSGSLTLSKSSCSLGDVIAISAVAGSNNSIGTPTWSYGSNSGTAGSNFDTSVLEPYLTVVTSANVTIKATQTYGGTLSKTLTVTVPNTYKPQLTFERIEYLTESGEISDYNYLLAGKNYPRIYFLCDEIPDGNTATFTLSSSGASYNPSSLGSPRLSSIVNAGGDEYYIEMYGASTKCVDSFSEYASYSALFNIIATDTRSRTATLSITSANIGSIYSYERPTINNLEISRCSSTGKTTPSGTYVYVEFESNDSILVLTNDNSYVLANNVKYALSKKEDSNIYYVIAGNGTLATDTQYSILVSIRNEIMVSTYTSEASVTISYTLGTMQMPISLYDDGSTVGVSIGEQAYLPSIVGSGLFMNFASKEEIVGVDDNGENQIAEKAYNIISLPSTIDNKFSDLKTNTLGGLKFMVISDVDYADLTTKDPDTIYFVYEA